ncbi:hypothetical protein RRG08_011644 [Elysia crispata]|uniref:MH1 domain-containing protein n=1 Tax=Elysia crispata TaxID=231223 RepID=A0AAE0YK30_9GAST|nr:hypothetical protein RRG08_011644 [Elysia crispata]
MFRSKRSSLVKRLWKYKLNDEARSPLQGVSESEHTTITMSPLSPASSSAAAAPAVAPRPRSTHFWSLSSLSSSSSSSSAARTGSSSSGSPTSPPATTVDDLDIDLKAVTHAFFKRLKEEQLENLLHAMESKGGEVTPCVPVSKTDLRAGGTYKTQQPAGPGPGAGPVTVSPHVLCCRVFRWPGLRSDTEMRRLPSCRCGGPGHAGSVVCCNPYHWSVVVKIDERPIHVEKLMPKLRSSKRHGKGGGNSARIIDTSPGGVTLSSHSLHSASVTVFMAYRCYSLQGLSMSQSSWLIDVIILMAYRCYSLQGLSMSQSSWLIDVIILMAYRCHSLHGLSMSQSSWLIDVIILMAYRCHSLHGLSMSQSSWLIDVIILMAYRCHSLHGLSMSQSSWLIDVIILMAYRCYSLHGLSIS